MLSEDLEVSHKSQHPDMAGDSCPWAQHGVWREAASSSPHLHPPWCPFSVQGPTQRPVQRWPEAVGGPSVPTPSRGGEVWAEGCQVGLQCPPARGPPDTPLVGVLGPWCQGRKRAPHAPEKVSAYTVFSSWFDCSALGSLLSRLCSASRELAGRVASLWGTRKGLLLRWLCDPGAPRAPSSKRPWGMHAL